MKKTITTVLTLILTCCFSLSICISGEKKHFRNATWGMTKKQVKSTETKTIGYDGEEAIGLFDSVNGLRAMVIYNFVDDKLTSGRYSFKAKHTNKVEYINDFNGLKEILIQKYGQPISEDIRWMNDLYRDSPQEHGFAVSVGHLKYYAEWETPDTKMLMMLVGDNYKINHFLAYDSKELGALEEQAKQKKNLGKL